MGQTKRNRFAELVHFVVGYLVRICLASNGATATSHGRAHFCDVYCPYRTQLFRCRQQNGKDAVHLGSVSHESMVSEQVESSSVGLRVIEWRNGRLSLATCLQCDNAVNMGHGLADGTRLFVFWNLLFLFYCSRTSTFTRSQTSLAAAASPGHNVRDARLGDVYVDFYQGGLVSDDEQRDGQHDGEVAPFGTRLFSTTVSRGDTLGVRRLLGGSVPGGNSETNYGSRRGAASGPRSSIGAFFLIRLMTFREVAIPFLETLIRVNFSLG